MDELQTLRKNIETIDEALIDILAKRFAHVSEIGKIKKASGIAIVDEDQEERILKKMQRKAKEQNLDPLFIKHLWEDFFAYAHQIEKR